MCQRINPHVVMAPWISCKNTLVSALRNWETAQRYRRQEWSEMTALESCQCSACCLKTWGVRMDAKQLWCCSNCVPCREVYLMIRGKKKNLGNTSCVFVLTRNGWLEVRREASASEAEFGEKLPDLRARSGSQHCSVQLCRRKGSLLVFSTHKSQKHQDCCISEPWKCILIQV